MSGNSYFSHDSNARNDSKVVRLRMKHGATGYGVYFMILERLREEKDYMSVKDYNMIAFDLRVDANLVKSVVEDFGLFAFTEDGECFYSESFNRRMSVKDDVKSKRAEAGRKGLAKRWGKSDEMANATETDSKVIANATETDSKVIANATETDSKESKVKEKKINKRKVVVVDARTRESKTDFEDFLKTFFDDHPAQVETLCMQMHTDEVSLRATASEVISEWELTQQSHEDYSDMARHLINQLRIKLKVRQSDGNNRRKNNQRGSTETITARPQDYEGAF